MGFSMKSTKCIKSRLQRFQRVKKRATLKEIRNDNLAQDHSSISNLNPEITTIEEMPVNHPSNTVGGLDVLSRVACMERELNCLKSENLALLKDKTDLLEEVKKLKDENEKLKLENNYFINAVHDLNKETKVISNFDEQEEKVIFYTSLPNLATFNAILNHVISVWKPKCQISLSYQEQLLLVLMKIRLGCLGQDLAYRFGISAGNVSTIFQQWITVLAAELQCLVSWPAENRKLKLPRAFRTQCFKDTTCIIDCTEVFIERATDMNVRSQTYSNYKNHNTIKFFVGINVFGAIIFLSKCWGGSASDKEITQKSGFLEKLKPGNVILADRGFEITDLLAARGVQLVIPAFTRGKIQLSRKEVEESRRLSRVRIHVERAIGRMKVFRILQSIMPISLVKNGAECTIDKIITICAALVNLKPPLVE